MHTKPCVKNHSKCKLISVQTFHLLLQSKKNENNESPKYFQWKTIRTVYPGMKLVLFHHNLHLPLNLEIVKRILNLTLVDDLS